LNTAASWGDTIQTLKYISQNSFLFGRLVLMLQIFIVKGLEMLFTLGSMESFNSVILCIEEDSLNVLFVVIVY